ncbi:MAG TPA: GtrA family protein [Ohtaekwangia sp.]|uniref:GtrA family protein n=1 Tax=Ohtaekwangia sp. TaxID=2066019 RepID=UPI002F934523
MQTFIKAQGASFFAWLVDTAVMILFVEIVRLPYTVSSVSGNIAGAVTHFAIGRGWVFNSDKAIVYQIIRYGLVWIGYVFLTTFLVFVFTDHLKVNYLVSKVTASVLTSVVYTYPMQKYFVFK